MAIKGRSRKHVAGPVAHPPAPLQVDLVPLGGLFIQQRSWFPTLAGPTHIGQMGTPVVAIQSGARFGQQLVQAILSAAIVVFGQQPAGNAGLVGDHYRQPAVPVQPLDSGSGSGQQPDLLGITQVSRVLDDGSVPIQKDGAIKNRRAASIARATAGKLDSGSVRGSKRTRSADTRATTAGVPSRSRRAKPSAPSGPASIATTVVGSVAPANKPPPTADSPATVEARTAAGQREASRAARRARSAGASVNMARTGIVRMAASGSW